MAATTRRQRRRQRHRQLVDDRERPTRLDARVSCSSQRRDERPKARVRDTHGAQLGGDGRGEDGEIRP